MANAEKCVCCGAVIPEGRQVCPSCEGKKMANEKRLIDANVLLTSPLWDYLKEGYEKSSARTIIATQHTVDAVEVVHGKWEIRPDPYRMFYPNYHCSVCGGWKHKLAYEHENMNYCPNCGAKMDGDGNGVAQD